MRGAISKASCLFVWLQYDNGYFGCFWGLCICDMMVDRIWMTMMYYTMVDIIQ